MKNLLKIFLLTLPLWGLGGFSFAQNKYFVLFKDKANSPYSVSKPEQFLSERSIKRRVNQKIKVTERDLPPNTAYISELAKLGKVIYKSRWFNGALVEATEANFESIKKLPFYRGIEGKGDITKARTQNIVEILNQKNKFEALAPADNGLSANQLAMMGVDKMQEKNLRGEGMWIGVLDSGFQNADKIATFKHLFDEKRIIGTYDFVSNEKSVYEDHNHGTNVLSCMAAFTDNQIVGTAPKASYLLLKTEDVGSETKIEEAYWLFGAEYADSVGVDVINTSLGYTEFDSPAQNYVIKNLDGETAIITRAADFASETGILVVCSAGNEGGVTWQKIGTPADADLVISVGAVNASKVRASFSSMGGKFTTKVKPELAAQGQGTIVINTAGNASSSNGTSFSSPLLAGMAASFWAKYPQFTAMEIRDILIKSGSQYAKPDSLLGYGIPDFTRAEEIAKTFVPVVLNTEEEAANSIEVSPNPFNSEINVKILKPSVLNQYDVALIDAKGAVLNEFKAYENQFKIQIDLPTGLYFLKVNGVGLRVVKRIIKQ